MASPSKTEVAELSEEAGFELLPPHLAEDLEAALRSAVDAGVAFVAGRSPLAILRSAVAESIRDIERHPMGVLLGRFLRERMPFDGRGGAAFRCLYRRDIGHALAAGTGPTVVRCNGASKSEQQCQ